MAKPSQIARRKIMDTAAALFFRDGYRAVGIDTIVAESGVGKMTLYRHFKTKEDLILAYLEESNLKFWNEFEQVTSNGVDARGKLIAFFKGLEQWVQMPICYGCPFLNIAVDFPQKDHQAYRVALQHKNKVRARFRALATEAGARAPKLLADQLYLLMDGAYMTARVFNRDNPAAHLGETAATLIDAQLS